MQRYVCIHGHFYQPPREDPWTLDMPKEPSANPFHDWNERIASECYALNAASPLPDIDGRAASIMNNYAWISFDFGPTLLRWLEAHAEGPYSAILEGDRQSSMRWGGHGSAMAQVFNHMIMPLATKEDRRTQVAWGTEDFERRFGRYPEGMWLPETAVDLDTLEALAEAGIRFTILSPDQASAVRSPQSSDWSDVSGGRIDTRLPYVCNLPSGKAIAIFFYSKAISLGIAFGDSLNSADSFARSLFSVLSDDEGPQLANAAADGETYGHHRRTGAAVLSECVARVEASRQASITNYGFFLSVYPPDHEVKIIERSSWSCPHGVERWRSNCGCGSEIRPGYNQEWRTPLRESLDWLRARTAEVYERKGSQVFLDPRSTERNLARVALERRKNLLSYVRGAMRPGLGEALRTDGLRLVEMLECSYLMLASCAWFWEDITRIETRQALRYAGRAMELAQQLAGQNLEPSFKAILARAKPNAAGFENGGKLYEAVMAR